MLPIEHLTGVSGALSLRYAVTRLLLAQRVGSLLGKLESLLLRLLFLLRHSRVHPLRGPVQLQRALPFLVYFGAAALATHQPVQPRDTFVFLAFNLFLPAITILSRRYIFITRIIVIVWSDNESRFFSSIIIVVLGSWDRFLLSFATCASRRSVFLGQASGQ